MGRPESIRRFIRFNAHEFRTIRRLHHEIILSYYLLFDRSEASRKLAHNFYDVYRMRTSMYGLDFTPITIDNVPVAEILKCFPYLGPRIVHLLERMDNWSPRGFRQLFIPSYTDRSNWWIAMFGLFFGFMSIVVVILNILLVYLGWRQLLQS
jgi:hypothetical protein